MPADARPASSGSRLNCGKRKLAGRLRTSQSVSTRCWARTARKTSISRFECPMVKSWLAEPEWTFTKDIPNQTYFAGRVWARQALRALLGEGFEFGHHAVEFVDERA